MPDKRGVRVRTTIRLEEEIGRAGSQPILDVIEKGRPYLWVGDENGCFSTLSLTPARTQRLIEALERAQPQARERIREAEAKGSSDA